MLETHVAGLRFKEFSILLILVEQTNNSFLGLAVHTIENIERLAAEAARLGQFVRVSPFSLPTAGEVKSRNYKFINFNLTKLAVLLV